MTKILTIDELAKQGEVDVSEYGLKAEGLAILNKAMHELREDPNNKDDEFEWRLKHYEMDLECATYDHQREAAEAAIQMTKELMKKHPQLPAINYEVDPAFVVPMSSRIDDTPALREEFKWLVSTDIKFMGRYDSTPQMENVEPFGIIMARSSDENEMPGKFESHSALYDPKDFEGSFQRWLEAARKVRESGAGGVIGQMLV
ncbi:hypothetical protein KY311_01900, partial [Candidatus Woesearchaeota archaeon]|nr:hypothetical protein [Candidatus Woesearchaeota archaeon]